ncbi:MAG: type 1 glutamine amidotransferase, partial [Alphaproteobacteria bacterium]
MKIGILETGVIHEDLAKVHGAYPTMFERMLNSVNPDIEFFSVLSCEGDVPESPAGADGWIITGSKHGVYDDLPWIAPLIKFLQDCISEQVPVAGICFGHQILAEAMGGKVEKSNKGWGIGVQSYDLGARPSWMANGRTSFAGHAVHQDQIVDLPPDANVIASSNFCNYAAIIY